MAQYDLTVIAVEVRKWDLESQRLSLKIYFVMDDEEKSYLFDLALTQVPEMVEEFLGKVLVGCKKQIDNVKADEEVELVFTNETFLRQKVANYFKRILGELNNPKRKKGQTKMIYTTHMDVYNENQDVSFLPKILQFYVVLNWARKYYEKEDFQRAVEPLRKLVTIKEDFGLGYKWLARSLKKVRRYEDAMSFYKKYAEVDNSLDAWLDLATSYRKGRLFDKSEEIYKKVLSMDSTEKNALIGLAQIKYARNEPGYLEILDDLNRQDPDWVKKWLLEEFNFRIYESEKSLLSPLQAARYLGYEKVYELTQRAFRNEVPSHFNPTKARMSFFKEELENWALIMNRFKVLPEEIVLYPRSLNLSAVKKVDIVLNEGIDDSADREVAPAEKKSSTRVEEIIRQIRATQQQKLRIKESHGARTMPEAPKKRRGRPPKSQTTDSTSIAESEPKKRGRPPKNNRDESQTGEPKKRRGRPPKNQNSADTESVDKTEADQPAAKKRGRPPKKLHIGADDGNPFSG